jgi:2-polyprenyl-3-methyl-5-hydroxy-6-metoxy-1,4-benzoquinol methylase
MKFCRPERFVLIVATVCMLMPASAGVAEETARKQFLAWFESFNGSVVPPEVMKAYAAKLTADGLAESDVREHMAAVQKYVAAMPSELLAIHFDRIYTAHKDLFSQEPNGFLVRSIRGVKPGTALDVAMGQGRNSVFLAMQGWDVTGYDLSEKGMAIARADAAKAGVKLQTVRATHQDFDFGKERWDLIVMTYAFVNMEDTAFLTRLRDSLKPGGRVIVEQINAGVGGKGPANALFHSMQDLRVIHYEDVMDTAEWSKAPMRLGRILAEKD